MCFSIRLCHKVIPNAEISRRDDMQIFTQVEKNYKSYKSTSEVWEKGFQICLISNPLLLCLNIPLDQQFSFFFQAFELLISLKEHYRSTKVQLLSLEAGDKQWQTLTPLLQPYPQKSLLVIFPCLAALAHSGEPEF